MQIVSSSKLSFVSGCALFCRPPPLCGVLFQKMGPRKRLRQASLSFTPQNSDGISAGDVEISRPSKRARENWRNQRHKTLHVMLPPKWVEEAAKKECRRVCAFDMDGTLIKTKSGAKHPKSADDWTFISARVVKKLEDEYAAGAVLVIFSNQAGLARGMIDESFIHERVEGIAKKINVPIAFYMAGAKDHYRKPAMGMWQAFVGDLGGEHCIDYEKSIFCGDAAGRPKRPGGVRADFADSDRKFALNVGLRFCTPEMFFHDGPDSISELPLKGYDSRSVDVAVNVGTSAELLKRVVTPASVVDRLLSHGGSCSTSDRDHLTMVILCGSPASGKTTFAEQHLVPRGFAVVGSDLNPLTPAKYGKLLTQYLSEGKSVCVDMTMRNKKARSLYIEKARKCSPSVHIIVLVFNTPPAVVDHLNLFRELVTSVGEDGKPARVRVPAVAINTFRAHFVEPDVGEEGIDDVGHVEFVPQVDSEDRRESFRKLYN